MNFAAFKNSLKAIISYAGPLVTAVEDIAPEVLGAAKFAAVTEVLKVAHDALPVIKADWAQVEGIAKSVVNEFAAVKHAFDDAQNALTGAAAPAATGAGQTAKPVTSPNPPGSLPAQPVQPAGLKTA